MSMPNAFSKPVIPALTDAKIVGVRSGTSHCLTGIWVVVF
jgi:hypothetical protein